MVSVHRYPPLIPTLSYSRLLSCLQVSPKTSCSSQETPPIPWGRELAHCSALPSAVLATYRALSPLEQTLLRAGAQGPTAPLWVVTPPPALGEGAYLTSRPPVSSLQLRTPPTVSLLTCGTCSSGESPAGAWEELAAWGWVAPCSPAFLPGGPQRRVF